MSAIFISLASLALAWLLHLILWRLRMPQAQLKTLLVIFFAVWLAVFVGIWSGWVVVALDENKLLGILYFCAIYWPAALCYVITYSAMEGDSPTLSLTRHLHRNGGVISNEEMEEFFRQRPFVGARINALVKDGVFVEEAGGYRLVPGGYRFFRLILGYRSVVFGSLKAGG